MSINELIRLLERLEGEDPELAHMEADKLLLEYIGDPRVREAFEAIRRWYA